MENSPLSNKIFGMCVVLDVANCFARCGFLLGGCRAVGSGGVDVEEGRRLVVVHMGNGLGRARFIGVLGGDSLGEEVVMRVIEMVCCVTKGVDFEFREEVLRNFLQEPIENHAAFDTTL